MMVFSFPHVYNGAKTGALDFVADIGLLIVTRDRIELVPPSSYEDPVAGDISGPFLVLRLSSRRYLACYKSNVEFNSRYKPEASENYILTTEEDESSNIEIVVIKPTGEELFRLPYLFSNYVGSRHLALGSDTEWRVFNMKGEVVFSIIRPRSDRNRGEARFSKPLFFFPLGLGEEYEVYDVERERATGVRRFNGAILAVLDLPDSSVLVADYVGIQRFQIVNGEVEISPMYVFESPVSEETRVLAWVDDRNAYFAFDIYEAQSLLTLPLNGEPVQRLLFPAEWRVDDGKYGFKQGLNFLPLARRYHTFDRAKLIWTPEETLSQASFNLDISDDIEIEQAASTVKGKHGYCIRVKDESVNKAIRSAASELSRLIHETCDHPLGWEGNILDKKFDGKFHVEIHSPDKPSEFEREYLVNFVAEFRDNLYFKPAKSKASLAVEVVWKEWKAA